MQLGSVVRAGLAKAGVWASWTVGSPQARAGPEHIVGADDSLNVMPHHDLVEDMVRIRFGMEQDYSGWPPVTSEGLRLVSVSFVEGNKWRVSDGESVFWVSMLDQSFLNDVTAGRESFNRTDIVRARLRTRHWRDAEGERRTEHSITEVLEHVRGSRDVPLPLIDPDGD